MSELTSSALPDLSDRARELAAALELDSGALGAVLFGLVTRLDAFLAIKEIATGRYVNVNARMAALFHSAAHQMMGQTDADLLHAVHASSWRAAEQVAAAQSGPHLSEHKVEIDGVKRDFSVTRMALPSREGPPRFLFCVWSEVTADKLREAQLANALQQLEQQQQQQQLIETVRRELADSGSRDVTTGLFQLGHFDDQLRREVDLSSREHREFALVSISLDPANDIVKALGEPARTRILEALGRLLRSNTRAMDASCRMDDTRFAVLLSGVGLATAHSRMEGLRRQCATQIVVLEGRDLGFTVSMGVSSFPHTAHTQQELMSAADQALKEAQVRGGNHVTLASIKFQTL
jgi:diguanylate cyclase (GGDEF)-like protein